MIEQKFSPSPRKLEFFLWHHIAEIECRDRCMVISQITPDLWEQKSRAKKIIILRMHTSFGLDKLVVRFKSMALHTF